MLVQLDFLFSLPLFPAVFILDQAHFIFFFVQVYHTCLEHKNQLHKFKLELYYLTAAVYNLLQPFQLPMLYSQKGSKLELRIG